MENRGGRVAHSSRVWLEWATRHSKSYSIDSIVPALANNARTGTQSSGMKSEKIGSLHHPGTQNDFVRRRIYVKTRLACVVFAILSTMRFAVAQQAVSSVPDAAVTRSFSVPRLIRFSGVAQDPNGKPLTGTIGALSPMTTLPDGVI